MFRRSKLTFLSTKDDRIKIINERINVTERHLIDMTTAFATCTRKMAKYRDSYDELAKSIKNYADDEEVNESLATGLKSFTNSITILGDYMDINVHRMEVKIINELAQFEGLCKTTRDNLRFAVIARDKEVLKQRQMIELKSKFAANNSAADSELVKAKMEVQRTNKEIDEIISNFEQRKLGELKAILENFIMIALKYHTKSLEVLTANYYDVSNIDEKDDLLEFQKLMKSKESPNSRKSMLKKGLRSQSMDSLERDLHISPLKRSSKLTRSTKNLSGSKQAASETDKSDEDADEDDDDDEEDNDDDDDDDDDDDEEDDEADDDDSVRSHGSAAELSVSNSEEPEPKKTPAVRENVFGVRSRSGKRDATDTGSPVKPTRSSVKHPFKAVAATHVLKTSTTTTSSSSHSKHGSKSKALPSTGIKASHTGVGIPSGVARGRLVTVVESKQQQQQQQTRKTGRGD